MPPLLPSPPFSFLELSPPPITLGQLSLSFAIISYNRIIYCKQKMQTNLAVPVSMNFFLCLKPSLYNYTLIVFFVEKTAILILKMTI